MTGTVITKKGMQLLIKVLASETMLKFTRIEVGTGGLPAGYDPANMVRLNRYKMDAMIAKCKADGDVAKITMQLGSQGIESGFIMSEIGIYAEDPDVGDILYAYLDLQDDPQYIYAEGGQAQKFLMFTLEVAIEEAAKVAAYINPEGLITRAEFERELRDVKEELARENEKTRQEFEELRNSAGSALEYDPDPEISYCVGDYRMHQGGLYKCVKDTAGEWDPECWVETDALKEIDTVTNRVAAIENPEFDDSGVVDSIKSFPDFLNTFKSKMNLFRLLRNMKAGFRFVLHTGSIVNSCTSEAEDLPLSAKQGKVLMDLYTQLYSDIDSQMVTTNFNDFLELSNGISVENVILVKRSKLIYISMEIYKTDNSSFSSARSTIGILKSGFTPQFKVYLTIPGETKRGSLVNTSGSLYIIKDGTIYIDRSNTDDPATCFSVMLSYFSS